MTKDGKAIAYGLLFAAAAAVAFVGWMARPAPAGQVTKPIPKATAPIDWNRFYDSSHRDLMDLGKIGPEHDRWILRKYDKPAPSSDYNKLKSRPLNPDTRIRPRPRIFQTA